MSLPTAKGAAQSSIRSFFTSSAPKYAPPPSSSSSSSSAAASNGISTSQTPPAPPPPPPAARQPDDAPIQPSPTAQLPLPPSPPSLPDEASLSIVTDETVSPLRRINALLLPVPYQDEFYNRAIDQNANGRYSRVILYAHSGEQPKVVGGVVSRLVDSTSSPGKKDLYISSLCVLAPYRGLGLVSAALDHVVSTAVLDLKGEVGAVTAHVWTGHEESLGWYERRGFTKQSPPVEGYYLKLRPASAWIVRRDVATNVRDALPTQNGTASSLPSGVGAPPPPPPKAVKPSTTAAVVNLQRPGPPRGQSYMDQRAETEWNDLPADMAPPQLLRKGTDSEASSKVPSTASSRSSSAARKKRDRSYPAAAFGAGS